jgi:hypothetical protein
VDCSISSNKFCICCRIHLIHVFECATHYTPRMLCSVFTWEPDGTLMVPLLSVAAIGCRTPRSNPSCAVAIFLFSISHTEQFVWLSCSAHQCWKINVLFILSLVRFWASEMETQETFFPSGFANHFNLIISFVFPSEICKKPRLSSFKWTPRFRLFLNVAFS